MQQHGSPRWRPFEVIVGALGALALSIAGEDAIATGAADAKRPRAAETDGIHGLLRPMHPLASGDIDTGGGARLAPVFLARGGDRLLARPQQQRAQPHQFGCGVGDPFGFDQGQAGAVRTPFVFEAGSSKTGFRKRQD